ncbi:hypothetical protein AAVH_29469 [Aphelenchoides avenae]|nr:hypothetical protein AAVH_29469 [Aphelenchus avenae]
MPSTEAEPPAYQSTKADKPILPHSNLLDARIIIQGPESNDYSPNEHNQLRHEVTHLRRPAANELCHLVAGMPAAAYMCIAAIHSATRLRNENNRTKAKSPAFGITEYAAEAVCDAEAATTVFVEAADAQALSDAKAADAEELSDAEVAFAAETASVAEALGIPRTTPECSPNEYDREALTENEAAFENAVTVRPYTVSPTRSLRPQSRRATSDTTSSAADTSSAVTVTSSFLSTATSSRRITSAIC